MTGPRIRIGTSGWHYPGGAGAWDGVFYPPRGRRHRPRGFDELACYAEHFDTVEVNSTFYGVPRRAVTEAWAARTPDDFCFSVKLYQKFTHPKMFAAATGAGDTRVDRGTSSSSARPSRPSTRPASSGPCWPSFPPASATTPPPTTTSRGSSRRCPPAPSRSSCGTGAGATTSPAPCGC